jgi:putative nucleotidyltransferase with HDIG domain
MSHEPEQVVRALVASDEARGLYGTSHAAAAAAAERCVRLIDAEAGKTGLALTLTASGVLVGDRVVSSPAVVMSEFVQRLMFAGVDHVRLSKGFAAADLEWLLNYRGTGGSVASPSGRVVLSSLRVGGGPSGATGRAAPAAATPGGDPHATVNRLRSVWEGSLTNQKHVQRETVAIAATITSTVVENRSSILPILTLRSHDEYTFVHVINVSILASALGEAIGLKRDVVHGLTEAALLHDVGKWLVPRRVLGKPGKLDQDERDLIEQHPVTGAAILAGSPGVSDIAVIVAYEHHRRIDGGGYPKRSRQGPPSIYSQMVHIADFFDALRSDRPYREGMPTEKCLEIMAKEAGGAFEKDLFDVFQRGVLARLPETPAEGLILPEWVKPAA